MSSLRFLAALALALVAVPGIAHAQQPAARPQPLTVQRSPSKLDLFFGKRSLLPDVADTAAARETALTCPMPVARPDTTRLERMPRVRIDSSRMAPMPVLRGCVAAAS
jgi:hypothetical protein